MKKYIDEEEQLRRGKVRQGYNFRPLGLGGGSTAAPEPEPEPEGLDAFQTDAFQNDTFQ